MEPGPPFPVPDRLPLLGNCAQHLFWLCPEAQTTWTFFLQGFASLVKHPITWDQIVFGSNMAPAPEAPSEAHEDIKTLFHITRSVVLRMLWLHRNELVFGHIQEPNFQRVKILSANYIKTHILSHFGKLWFQGQFSDLFDHIFSLTAAPSPREDSSTQRNVSS
ncbi:hypothetical protein H310_15224 [Aphanomyces invadans]|uniref:Uncharacterized protein n=1 Tax=Aphanomyces invadans TaxID=157072 RepID=A0A024T7M3_9STRA|nr:hypothetical protein H310_15224 [Aphanomyces invadans]ETV89935.1 hypothetical protein H310_15224 [Aphanomyces invadans]|eukprot:XP_008881434.1 hypothetical protein H310_15224 [Aphanomyces invadans]